MKVTVYGNIWGVSGYAIHTRSLANALQEVGAEVSLITNLGDENWLRNVTDQELAMINRKPDMNAHTIAITIPPFWSMIAGEGYRNIYGFLVWEGDRIPKDWLVRLFDNRLRAILVPSSHVRDAIVRTYEEYVSEKIPSNFPMTGQVEWKLPPIHIVPHGVDIRIFKPQKVTRQEQDFTFIANAGWAKGMADRKGMQFLLRAFCEEFTAQDKVKLIVKVNPAYLPQGWDLQKELDKIGINRQNKSKIFFTTNVGTQQEVATLYNQADCFVCTQMADAFNIPGIEAMACGIPTIQSEYGGQTDYVTGENGWLNPEMTMVPAPIADYSDTIYEGVNWAMPNENIIRKLLRHAVEHPDEVKKKGQQALQDAQAWTWIASARKLLNYITN